MWILTPTASETLLNGFHATPDEQNWPRGIYFLGEYLRTAIVVIHQLPETEATLWLRILGRGRVQERAIIQLSALSVENPIRSIALELLYKLQSSLAGNQEQQLEIEDRELIMAIAPLFQQQLEAAKQEGKQEGQRSILESFFRMRFNESDAVMTAFLTPVSALSATEFTMLLLQLSALTVNAQGMQQARQLLAENVLRMRFGELGDTADATLGERFPVLLQNLLALSAEELTLLLQQLPQLSDEELLTRLSD